MKFIAHHFDLHAHYPPQKHINLITFENKIEIPLHETFISYVDDEIHLIERA